MLFAFHKSQNAKKSGSIHATYLLYGSKRSEEPKAQDDGDIDMGSSMPEPEDALELIPAFTLSLVQEEELEGT
jgi:DNA polymerase delta subunit 3